MENELKAEYYLIYFTEKGSPKSATHAAPLEFEVSPRLAIAIKNEIKNRYENELFEVILFKKQKLHVSKALKLKQLVNAYENDHNGYYDSRWKYLRNKVLNEIEDWIEDLKTFQNDPDVEWEDSSTASEIIADAHYTEMMSAFTDRSRKGGFERTITFPKHNRKIPIAMPRSIPIVVPEGCSLTGSPGIDNEPLYRPKPSTVIPPVESASANFPGQPILLARKKTKKESTPDGKTTFRAILDDNKEWEIDPDNVIIKNKEPIATKIDPASCEAIAIAIEREKRVIELLSVPQHEAELEKIHVEILSERNYKPMEIASLMYPNASNEILRAKAVFFSNHINSLKKKK